MIKQSLMGISLISLVACAQSGASDSAAKADPCANVTALMQSGAADTPYESLRGDNKMLGDRPLNDSWWAKSPAFGEACEIHDMGGFFGAQVHTYKCTLYAETSSFDKEEHQTEANAIVDKVKATLETCLGSDWTSEEDLESNDYDIYRKIVFEPKSGRPGADEFDFTVDPAYIEMSYSPFMRGRGGPSGWIVDVQFQQQRKPKE